MADMAIERFELPVRLARQVGCITGLFLLIIFAWSALAPVNVVAKGQGQLEPYGRPLLVQSQVEGRVEQLSVREGAQVRKDDTLVTLESEIFRDQLDQAQMNLKKGKTELAQIEQGIDALASVIKDPTSLPSSSIDIGDVAEVVNQVYTTHKDLVESRYDAVASGGKSDDDSSEMTDLRNMKTRLSNEVGDKLRQSGLLQQQTKNAQAQKQAEINGLIEQIASHKEMLNELQSVLAISVEQQKDYSEVLDLGVSRVQYLNITEKVAEASRKVKSEKTTIQQLENQLKMARLELKSLTAENQAKLAGLAAEVEQGQANIEDVNVRMRKDKRELNKVEAAYNAALEKAKAALARQTGELDAQRSQVKEFDDAVKIAEKNMDKSVIKAPASGTVTGVTVRGTGEVIKPGQELMSILPNRAEMVLATKIPNRDIGFVKVGQDARIKLDAFPFQDFGVLHGKVHDIERYPEKDETRGYAYTVWIQPDTAYITAMGRQLPLKNGLTAECEIVVRKVSVLRALLEPVAKLSDVSVRD